MRRILLVLSLMAVTAMVMAAMAMPAFSKVKCEGDPFSPEGQECRGGSSISEPGGINNGQVGGGGGRSDIQCDPDPETGVCTGESSGGFGGHFRF